MQKSLLDSIVEDNVVFDTNNPVIFDHLFCLEAGSHIFMLRVKTPGKKESFPIDVQKLLNTSLPGDISICPASGVYGGVRGISDLLQRCGAE